MDVQRGDRFGPYEVLERIGAGGMGEVWQAIDTRLDRRVALKLLPSGVARDPERLHRFAQEAKATAAIDHPNILAVHDIGTTDAGPFIVTELLEGRSLAERIADGLTPAKAVEYGIQVARGLAAAHDRGVIHRDLKPANLFVTGDGVVKILDFGLAKLAQSDAGDSVTSRVTSSGVTSPGAMLGTVGYMAPEQVAGDPADHRADIFAFGCVLYEMLSRRRAFHADTSLATLMSILEDDPPPLSSSDPRITPALERVVVRCLEKHPEDRYQSAHDVALALEAAAAGSGATSSARPGRGRRAGIVRWLLPLAATLAVAGIVVLTPAPVRYRALAALGLASTPTEARVVVLPFTTDGGGEEKRLSDGLTEYLVARLGQLERLRSRLWVTPMSEVLAEGVTSAEGARHALGATLVVSGSLRHLDGVQVLTLSLVDTAHRRQLRAITDRPAPPPDVLPERVVDEVVGMLDIELTGAARAAFDAGGTAVAEAARLYTEGLAYTPYLQARNALQRHDQQQSLERSTELFTLALDRDPDFGLAHAGLGEAYWRLYQLTKRRDLVAMAERECQRALVIDDNHAPAWVTLGLIDTGTGRENEALTAFRRAVALDPHNADARRGLGSALDRLGHSVEAEEAYRRAIALAPSDWRFRSQLAVFLVGKNRYEEAESELRHALMLAPKNARLWSHLGAALYFAGDKDKAAAAFERSIELHPSWQAMSNLAVLQFSRKAYSAAARTFEQALPLGERDYRLWRNLGAAYYWAPGERSKAAAAYRRALELGEAERELDPDNGELLAELADCHAMLGEAGAARALAARARKLAPSDAAVTVTVAGVYEQLGERETAVELLAAALREGYSREDLDANPTFAGLRADPRLQPTRAESGSG